MLNQSFCISCIGICAGWLFAADHFLTELIPLPALGARFCPPVELVVASQTRRFILRLCFDDNKLLSARQVALTRNFIIHRRQIAIHFLQLLLKRFAPSLQIFLLQLQLLQISLMCCSISALVNLSCSICPAASLASGTVHIKGENMLDSPLTSVVLNDHSIAISLLVNMVTIGNIMSNVIGTIDCMAQYT